MDGTARGTGHNKPVCCAIAKNGATDFKLKDLNYHEGHLAPGGLSCGPARSGSGHVLVGPDIDIARGGARFHARLVLILINRLQAESVD